MEPAPETQTLSSAFLITFAAYAGVRGKCTASYLDPAHTVKCTARADTRNNPRGNKTRVVRWE